MLDIKLIRNQTDYVKTRLADRGTSYDADIDAVLQRDDARRALIFDNEQLKARQNEASRQIPAMKKAGQPVDALMAQMAELSAKIKEDDAKLAVLDAEITDLLARIPNLPDASVPVGANSDDNVEVRRWGQPRSFSFEPKPHWDIGRDLGILDPESAAKVTGARFHFYRGLGARLERAVINFYLDTHTSRGYTEVFPPFMVNKDSMFGTGQLPKFAEDMFKLEGLDYYLIPTAEVPVTNYHREIHRGRLGAALQILRLFGLLPRRGRLCRARHARPHPPAPVQQGGAGEICPSRATPSSSSRA